MSGDVRVRPHSQRRKISSRYLRHRPVFRLSERLKQVEGYLAEGIERPYWDDQRVFLAQARVTLAQIIEELEEDEKFERTRLGLTPKEAALMAEKVP
jgi:hypothetical protein